MRIMEPLKPKQDNLFYEWNSKEDKLEVLWILETDEGKFYQNKKSINGKYLRKALEVK